MFDDLLCLYVKKRENSLTESEEKKYERLVLMQDFDKEYVEKVLEDGYRKMHEEKI